MHRHTHSLETIFLVTGFLPFQTFRRNPSGEIVRILGETSIPGIRLEGHVLEVKYTAVEAFSRWLKDNRRKGHYEAGVLMGLNARSNCLQLERIGVNLEDSRKPDENGDRPEERSIDPGAPDGFMTAFPIHEIAGRMNQAGFPCKISNTAGTYVCNSLYYRMLQLSNLSIKGILFIHLPRISHRWTIRRLVSAVELLIKILHEDRIITKRLYSDRGNMNHE